MIYIEERGNKLLYVGTVGVLEIQKSRYRRENSLQWRENWTNDLMGRPCSQKINTEIPQKHVFNKLIHLININKLKY